MISIPLFRSPHNMQYWVYFRIVLDTLGMRLIKVFKGLEQAQMMYPFTIFPSLPLGLGLISSLVLASRLRTPYPNRFTIKTKNTKTTNRYCTLL